jgi:hypothetical protein
MSPVLFLKSLESFTLKLVCKLDIPFEFPSHNSLLTVLTLLTLIFNQIQLQLVMTDNTTFSHKERTKNTSELLNWKLCARHVSNARIIM